MINFLRKIACPDLIIALALCLVFSNCAGESLSVSALPRFSPGISGQNTAQNNDTIDPDRDFQLPEESKLDKFNDKTGFVVLGIAAVAVSAAAVIVPIWLMNK